MAPPISFTATAEPRARGGIRIRLPFDPADAWGERDRYYLRGTIQGYGMRGSVTPADDGAALELGPSWCRDPRVGPGAILDVRLDLEGPHLDTIGPDLAEAIRADAGARRFFESLATFYRNAWVSWVESAKRPETRATRIAETVAALKAGRRER